MQARSRISDIDFKNPRARRPRRRMARLCALGLGVCLLGGGLLLALSAGDASGPAGRESASSEPEAEHDRGSERLRMRLALPGQDAAAALPEMGHESAAGGDLPASPIQIEQHADSQASPGEVAKLEADAMAPAARLESESDGEVDAKAEVTGDPLETLDAAIADDEPASPEDWEILTVRAGDNLAALFQRAGLSARDVHDVVNADERARRLTRIHPGDTIELNVDEDDRLQAVRYQMSDLKTLQIARKDDAYTSSVLGHAPEVRTARASATITSSLFAAGAAADLDDRLIMELAGIFGWDVDFALDIRRGDAFTVIYEELYREGEKLRSGDIVAAEFINQGEVYRAVRYTDPDGRTDFYTPEGRSMRRAFLRTPVNFSRVSSDFNPQRLHPVLGKKRPHMGTDYAAPTGTPIKAAGDGKVIHRGRKGGYGNTVIIQHGTRYTTLYAHMSRFKSGLHAGDRVRQGETIGYVGSTGLSTGPHLHYEFRVDGTHRNPRTVELPEAEPIPARFEEGFRRSTRAHLAELDNLSRTRLAQADDHN